MEQAQALRDRSLLLVSQFAGKPVKIVRIEMAASQPFRHCLAERCGARTGSARDVDSPQHCSMLALAPQPSSQPPIAYAFEAL